ncbi:hypothetical protein [uncultured Chitinophaga sp.]|jgi:hypothetical protein|uniref:hypothetical protein n=1 Tax=uncultured Chitinophaga sp. TaxID=339340 RepID=UPI00260938F9|nr:hypothetical protein [uncultured Chitinophaga sp.]
MTRRQLNLLDMYQAVLSHLDKFPGTWNQLTPVTPIVDNLRTIVAEMLTQSQLQAQCNPTGYTKRKDAHMFEIVERAFQLSLKLRSYAKFNNDHVLMAAVDLAYSTLARGPQQLVFQRCQRIAQHARDHLSELAAYQVTEEEVTMLEAQLNTTEPMTPARNVILGARKTATGSIPALVTRARKALDALDDLVEGMIDDAMFVSTYFNVRQVYDRVGRSAGSKEKVEE